MKARMIGLRGKSLLALALACVVALVPALLFGWQVTSAIRNHFAEAYARNLTLLNRERILAPISRELALSLRLADSVLLREMLRAPGDAAARARFFAEEEGFRADFRDATCFIVDRGDLGYYFNQPGMPFSSEPRYRLDEDDPEDSWFFATIGETGRYNINVNYDAKLRQTRIWINALARERGKVVGVVGSGLDLSAFVRAYLGSAGRGVLPMISNGEGAFQAHPDPSRVALNSAGQAPQRAQTLFGYLAPGDHERVRAALARSREQPDEALLLTVLFEGSAQMLAIAYIPELRWHVLTALDAGAADIAGNDWLHALMPVVVLTLLLLLAGFGYSVERIVLRPLRRLQQSAGQIARGNYEVRLPAGAGDEIGGLTRAFQQMADTVARHTLELEGKVRDRTAALEASHADAVAAHRKIDDSIDYASLIQRAILPQREIDAVLGGRHFVLWRPRDVVGGDFYMFRADGENFLVGVMDCAGHGVPGALMTMLARSAIDNAVQALGARDPAAVLEHADAALRLALGDAAQARALATNTDAGLVYVDRRAGELVFAGAAIDLFVAEEGAVEQCRGSRRALADRRRAEFVNLRRPLCPGALYCLVTDGLLDQAGGDRGYGFGTARLREFLRGHAGEPLPRQAELLAGTLARWQGGFPQRDDITVLSFRLD